MQQQINLYLPEFRPNREPLRAVHMVLLLVALLMVLVLWSLFTARGNSQLEQQVAERQAALDVIEQQLLAMARSRPESDRAALEREATRLEREIERRQLIHAAIGRENLGNAAGFSAQLEAMARQSLDTLSLESFSLQQGGSYVELRGRAQRADQVPLYLQQLRSEDSFRQVRFGVLEATRDERGGVQFGVARPVEERR